MVRTLIGWSLNNPFVVILLAIALAIVGSYAFLHVNVEAYPDPAPAIIEVVAQFPGASAEEVERQVTIPLEVTLAGMPGLTYTRSKSLFGLAHLRNQFEYGYEYEKARQEVINRLQFTQPLPPGVTPQISPQSPTGEIYRYTLKSPKDRYGNDIYTLNDLKALQDWVLERQFRRVPRIVDVTSSGGTVKRYEVHPDADRLRRYGITLAQVQAALANSNQNVGGDYMKQGDMVLSVRSIGLYGGGLDPVQQVLGMDKQALDLFRDTCLAELLGLGPSGQRGVIWPLLAERRFDLTNPKRKKHSDLPPPAGELGQRVVAIERIVHGVEHQKVAPPLTAKEKDQVTALRRLRAAVAGQKVSPPLDAHEKNTVHELKRIIEGYCARPVKPDLDEDERIQVDAIRTWTALRASLIIRSLEEQRISEIRQVVITSINNKPVKIDHIVEGGPLTPGEPVGLRGVVVSHQTRLGRVSLSKPRAGVTPDELFRLPPLERPRLWRDEDDKVQCIVLLRKGEDSPPALRDVRKKVTELNDPTSGRMLPGVQIETYYDRGHLIDVTTDTVEENLLLGIALVTVILLMFLSNVRTAIIVAINIPLALFIAFSLLYFRGQSANLLSIGAVDFGIIVDSSVIMAENIYRHLSSGELPHLTLKERILHACHEIEKPLFFSTLIMVCAFIPLFTMTGPEGQLFGPMAHTYAFSLAGALILAVTLTPVLCLYFLKHLKPMRDNFLVRFLRGRYLWQLGVCLKYRWTTLIVMGCVMAATAFILPSVGREFMPQLEEGNLWITATFPLNSSMERVAENIGKARKIMASYPEVEVLVPAIGRPDDGTDPTGYYRVEVFAPLRSQKEWPKAMDEKGVWRWIYGPKRCRTKDELVSTMNEELRNKIPGVDWNFSQYIRDNVTEAISGVKGDNVVKIFGPDLYKLEELAGEVKNILRQTFRLSDKALADLRGAGVPEGVLEKLAPLKDKDFGTQDSIVKELGELLDKGERKRYQETILDKCRHGVRGIEEVGIFNIMGQSNLEFRIDLKKCDRWGVAAADVNNVIRSAVGGQAMTSMIEGEKIFDVTIRWPKWQRSSEISILDIPLDITNNQVVIAAGPSPVPSATGSGLAGPTTVGTTSSTANPISNTPRLRLRDLVSPVGPDGAPDPDGSYEKAAASTIYRQQGERLIAIKFNIRGRDLASTVDEAKEKTKHLFESPYRVAWEGEFQEMERAELRLFFIIPLSLGLIFVLLYMAFQSLMDAVVVLSNVFDLAVGGIWALYLTGTHFSTSAAVGFVSLFGVAIMDGLLLISYFNHMRAQGLPLNEAILQGAEKRARPVMMTALTAILGLLPAALSTKIGAQTQQPLAIVVVGGMVTTLFLTRYLMPVLYTFYGHREPPAGSGGLAH